MSSHVLIGRLGAMARLSSGFAVVSALLPVLHAARGETPQGSIVGWGSQVVGVDLSQGFAIPEAGNNRAVIAAGGVHSLGLKSDGSIVGWGYNCNSEINVPPPNAGFVAVAAGGCHSLGLESDGSIVAWGCNSNGQTNVPAPNAEFIAAYQRFPEDPAETEALMKLALEVWPEW